LSAKVGIQQILQHKLTDFTTSSYTDKVLSKLRDCRTATMGYHLHKCDNPDCNHVHYQYHGCRNRHCPTCNWLKQEEWMEARMNELLPVKYFHVVLLWLTSLIQLLWETELRFLICFSIVLRLA
jgi:hypothetical protein